MSVEIRMPTAMLVLSAMDPLGGGGTTAARPFLDIERAVHDDTFRKCDERRPLGRPGGAPSAQCRGVHPETSGQVAGRVPGVGQEGCLVIGWDGMPVRSWGLCCGLLLAMGFGVGACCYRDGQVRAISGQYGAPGGRWKTSDAGDTLRERRRAPCPVGSSADAGHHHSRLCSETGVDQMIVSGYAGLADRRSRAMLPG